MQVSLLFLKSRFSHKNIEKNEIQKFIRDNEKYILESKRKNGKTRIDKDINEYLRKKNANKIHPFNITENNTFNNNLNYQMINNSLLAMNYLLLQNQFILQQNNQNLMNTISSNIIQHNKTGVNNHINKEDNNNIEKRDKKLNFNSEKNKIKNKENKIKKIDKNNFNKNRETFKKILEAVNIQNNNKKIKQNDLRKK